MLIYHPKMMKFRKLRHNYHEAGLVNFACGHHEIIIDAVLNPYFNALEQPVRVALSGVDNADGVAAFLAPLRNPKTHGTAITEINALQYTGTGPNWILLSLTRRVISDPGDIVIRAKQVHET